VIGASATFAECFQRLAIRASDDCMKPHRLAPVLLDVIPQRTLHLLVARLELAGLFPQRRQISLYKVGWLESEIDEWMATRPTGGFAARNPKLRQTGDTVAEL
jgi:hypothetical protein